MSIEARLTLNPDDYTAALEQASKSTENFKKKAEQAGQTASQAAKKTSASWRDAFNKIRKYATIKDAVKDMAGGGLLANIFTKAIDSVPTIIKEIDRDRKSVV